MLVTGSVFAGHGRRALQLAGSAVVVFFLRLAFLPIGRPAVHILCLFPHCALQLRFSDTADELPDFQRLADVGGMAPSTIRDGFRQMLPYLATVSAQ
jgi:hypothetical protein